MEGMEKVLVIDEEAYLLRNFVSAAEAAGYHVRGTANVEEGTRLARQLQPDVILLNTIPPDGMGRLLRQQVKTEPAFAGTGLIVFASGTSPTDEPEADVAVCKPISSRELLARVQLVLRLKKAERELTRVSLELRRNQHTLRTMQKELQALRRQQANEPTPPPQAEPVVQPARIDWRQTLPVGWCEVDKFGMIAALNPMAADVLGVAAADAQGTFFPDRLVEDDVATFFEHLTTVFESRTRQTCELRITSPKGASRYLLVESVALQAEGESDMRCCMALTDISSYPRRKERTGKKHSEKATPQNSPFDVFPLQAILEAVQEGITVSDTLGRFVLFNAQMEKLCGYTRTEANRYKNFSALLYPAAEQYQRAMTNLQETLLNGRSRNVDLMLCAKDGVAKPVRVSMFRLHCANQDWVLSTYQAQT